MALEMQYGREAHEDCRVSGSNRCLCPHVSRRPAMGRKRTLAPVPVTALLDTHRREAETRSTARLTPMVKQVRQQHRYPYSSKNGSQQHGSRRRETKRPDGSAVVAATSPHVKTAASNRRGTCQYPQRNKNSRSAHQPSGDAQCLPWVRSGHQHRRGRSAVECPLSAKIEHQTLELSRARSGVDLHGVRARLHCSGAAMADTLPATTRQTSSCCTQVRT